MKSLLARASTGTHTGAEESSGIKVGLHASVEEPVSGPTPYVTGLCPQFLTL